MATLTFENRPARVVQFSKSLIYLSFTKASSEPCNPVGLSGLTTVHSSAMRRPLGNCCGPNLVPQVRRCNSGAVDAKHGPGMSAINVNQAGQELSLARAANPVVLWYVKHIASMHRAGHVSRASNSCKRRWSMWNLEPGRYPHRHTRNDSL